MDSETKAQIQKQADINRRFHRVYLEGVIFEHDADTDRYRVRTDSGIETDWCRALLNSGASAALVGDETKRAVVLQPHGDDENGLIIGIVEDGDFNR